MPTATRTNPLSCLARVRAVAASVGATLDEDMASDGSVVVDAPAGYVWRSNGWAALTEGASNGSQSWWADACRDVLGQMGSGLRLVTDDERADVEHGLGEPWRAPAGSPEEVDVVVRKRRARALGRASEVDALLSEWGR